MVKQKISQSSTFGRVTKLSPIRIMNIRRSLSALQYFVDDNGGILYEPGFVTFMVKISDVNFDAFSVIPADGSGIEGSERVGVTASRITERRGKTGYCLSIRR